MENREVYLIVGLGNPEDKYSKTRHNIGRITINHLIDGSKFINVNDDGIKSLMYANTSLNKLVVFVKPCEGMNDSGKVVKLYVDTYEVPLNHILIISDDISLPIGKIRFRKSGSSGGHNGLKSIENEFGTNEFPRLKIGIGHNFENGKLLDYVLGVMDDNELDSIPFNETSAFIFEFTHGVDFDRLMEKYN